MNLSEILLLTSVVGGLLSIPFVVTGPLSDNIPTGEMVLGMEAEDVETIPNKMTKVFSSDKFEKTYETAFGRFTMSISSNKVKQELSKPGMVTQVTEDIKKTVWKITTQACVLELVRTPDSVTQTCTTPDGELIKVKQRGEVTETFQGMNQDSVMETCAQAEETLQAEVEKMEQIKSESEIPSTETQNGDTTPINGGDDVVINEFLPDPEGSDSDSMPAGEWVELYNMRDEEVNVSGWVLYDSEDDNELYIETTNTDTGDTIIPVDGYLVVYRDGDGDFALGNTGDSVRLYDGYPVADSNLIDEVIYSSSTEGYSWVRNLDGTGTLEETSTPTPGAPNS